MWIRGTPYVPLRIVFKGGGEGAVNATARSLISSPSLPSSALLTTIDGVPPPTGERERECPSDNDNTFLFRWPQRSRS